MDTPIITSPSISEQFKNNGIDAPALVTPVVKNDPIVNDVITPVVNNTPDNTDWKAEVEKLKAEQKELLLKLEAKTAVVEKVLTPEEIAMRDQQEEEELVNYIVLEKKMKATDYENFVAKQNQSNRDFVWANYLNDRKLENPDISESEALIDFESEYNLLSGDEKALARANKRLDAEAIAIKNEMFKPFSGIKNEFKTHKSIKAKAESYNKLVTEALPAVKVSYKLDDEMSIESDIAYEDVIAEIKQELLSAPYFSEFTKEGVDTKKAIDEFITSEAKSRKQEATMADIINKAVEAKTKKTQLGAISPPEQRAGSVSETTNTFAPSIQKLINENK